MDKSALRQADVKHLLAFQQSPRITQIVTALLALMTGVVWIYFIARTFPDGVQIKMLDFSAYWDAGQAALHGQNPYDESIRRNSTVGFVYPPIFLIAFLPFTLLPLNISSVVWYILTLVLLISTGHGLLRLIGFPRPVLVNRLQGLLLFSILLIAFLPVWVNTKLGQVSGLQLWGIVISLVLLRSGKVVWGGMLLGLMAALKMTAIPILFFAVWVGWRKYGIVGIITCCVLQLISAIVYPSYFFEYWSSVVLRIGPSNTSVNISLPGIMQQISPNHPILYPITLALAAIALLIPAILGWRARNQEAQMQAFGLMLVATSVSSPLVQNHYMIWMLFPLWMIICTLAQRPRWYSILLFGITMVIFANPYRISRLLDQLLPISLPESIWGEAVLQIGTIAMYLLFIIVVLRLPRSNERVAPGSDPSPQGLSPL